MIPWVPGAPEPRMYPRSGYFLVPTYFISLTNYNLRTFGLNVIDKCVLTQLKSILLFFYVNPG